jgi:hypothetical protein
MNEQTKRRVKSLLQEIIDVVNDEDGGKNLFNCVVDWAEEAEALLPLIDDTEETP